MIDYATIGKRIQTKRQERNITQEKLAEQVGISVVYLSKIENGRVYPTLETLSNICTELDTELAEILTNTEIARKDYANDRVVELFNSCSMRVKPIALALLEDLSKLTRKKSPPREELPLKAGTLLFYSVLVLTLPRSAMLLHWRRRCRHRLRCSRRRCCRQAPKRGPLPRKPLRWQQRSRPLWRG